MLHQRLARRSQRRGPHTAVPPSRRRRLPGLLALLLPYGWLEVHAGSCLAHVDAAAQAGSNAPMNLWTLALSVVVVFGAWLGLRAVAGLVWLMQAAAGHTHSP